MNAKKMILMGFDGAMSHFVRKFVEEGKTPNTARLVENGFFAEAYPTAPCDTPTNWATIATGASTGVHGVTGFYLHVPGEPLDEGARNENRGRGQLSYYCDAEYLWETAARAGKRSLIINYRGGWPCDNENVVVINGDGRPIHYVASPMRYVRREPMESDAQLTSVELRRAEGWESVEYRLPALEATIAVDSPYIDEGLKLTLTVLDSYGEGYDRVVIGRPGTERDDGEMLGVGDWTPWFEQEFALVEGEVGRSTTYYIQPEPASREVIGFFRFHLTELAPDGSRLELFRSHVFTTRGWTHPAELGGELLSELDLGQDFYLRVDQPIEDDMLYWSVDEGREVVHIAGGVHVRREEWGQLQGDQVEADRLLQIIEYVDRSRGWDLCFFHFHLMDRINHRHLTHLIPESPGYSEAGAKEASRLFENAYKLVDGFVGELSERCGDEDTVMVYVADHAVLPCWRSVDIFPALVEAGLLEFRYDSQSERFMVDWSRTKVFPYTEPPYLWVNLAGRDPDGIVEGHEYDEVRERAITALYGIRDPETGECPIALVLKKDDAKPLHQFGERVGDVVYFVKPTYRVPLRYQLELGPTAFGDSAVRYDTTQAHHSFYLPTATYGPYSVASALIISGPGVKKGGAGTRPVHLNDVAPTVSHLMGISSPAQSDGRVLYEALEG